MATLESFSAEKTEHDLKPEEFIRNSEHGMEVGKAGVIARNEVESVVVSAFMLPGTSKSLISGECGIPELRISGNPDCWDSGTQDTPSFRI